MDRLDILITEKDANIDKSDIVNILRVLAYFRPRDFETKNKKRKEAGKYT